MSGPQGSLRKAAILIASLETRSADQLLDQMGEQQAAKVRHAIMELPDIDPAEQEAVIHEFVGRPALKSSGRDTSGGGTGVELDASLSAKFGNGAAVDLPLSIAPYSIDNVALLATQARSTATTF